MKGHTKYDVPQDLHNQSGWVYHTTWGPSWGSEGFAVKPNLRLSLMTIELEVVSRSRRQSYHFYH